MAPPAAVAVTPRRSGKRRRQRLRTNERMTLVRLWYRCKGNIRRVLALWREECANRRRLSGRTVLATIERFHELGSVLDRARCGRSRSVRVCDNIRLVRESVRREPMLSTRKRASQLGLSRSSLMRIQKLDLGVKAYKVQMVQQLLPMDTQNRIEFSERLLREIARDDSFVHRLIMGDEAHFDLDGGVSNRQNVRFWGTQNPHLVRPRAVHSVRVTVWCGVSSCGILGPYFFEDRVTRRNVSVTGDRYREMLLNYVQPRLDRRRRGAYAAIARAGGWWWQQDGATAHTAGETMSLLRRMFGARLISRGANFAWPARSPDLTAADYFLWGYLKDRVYDGCSGESSPPQTLAQLKEAIVREIATLNGPNSRTMRRAVMENLVARASACLREKGGHLRDVVFHT